MTPTTWLTIRPHLSHDDFEANEALLWLSLLAFNLASIADRVRGGNRQLLRSGPLSTRRAESGWPGREACPVVGVNDSANRGPVLEAADRPPGSLATSRPIFLAARPAGPRLAAAAATRLPVRGAPPVNRGLVA